MWRVGVVVFLATLTPGAVLAVVQAWTPAILALSTLAGTALAVAGAAYRKAAANERRLAVVERLTPKRATDAAHVSGQSSVTVRPNTLAGGVKDETVTLHQGDTTE